MCGLSAARAGGVKRAAQRFSREYDFGKMRVLVKLIFISSLAFAVGARTYVDSPFCKQRADNSKAVRSKSTLITRIEGDAVQIPNYLGAERWMQKKIPYESWNHVADRLSRDIIDNTSFPPQNHGQPSLLKEDGYRKEMTGVLQKPFGFQFVPGNQADVLVNGPASFAKRKELIEQARESIYMFAWAFYDDGTGWEFADWLINAKLKRLCEGGDLDIKIVVDGNVAREIGYRDVLNYLEKYPAFSKNPIQIVHLKDKRDPYMGMHRKVMIVDRQHMVMGGMNVGNIYSHLYPDKGGRWRDTDIYVRGPAINQAQMTFVDEWNEQKGRKELTFLPYDFVAASGAALSMIVDHQPLRDANIHIATVKAFYGATQAIDIENAYFILDAVMERALADALGRGVRVRILSNSKDSIDEPVMTVPILQSLARLKKQGAEVFTKRVYDGSTTLHSKFLVVDGVFCWIGSYNFHPRSYRYEREIVFASFDENLAAQFDKIFAEDIVPERAAEPSLEELLNVKSGLLNKEVRSHFFDQL
jgi:cardiolipin synthase